MRTDIYNKVVSVVVALSFLYPPGAWAAPLAEAAQKDALAPKSEAADQEQRETLEKTKAIKLITPAIIAALSNAFKSGKVSDEDIAQINAVIARNNLDLVIIDNRLFALDLQATDRTDFCAVPLKWKGTVHLLVIRLKNFENQVIEDVAIRTKDALPEEIQVSEGREYIVGLHKIRAGNSLREWAARSEEDIAAGEAQEPEAAAIVKEAKEGAKPSLLKRVYKTTAAMVTAMYLAVVLAVGMPVEVSAKVPSDVVKVPPSAAQVKDATGWKDAELILGKVEGAGIGEKELMRAIERELERRLSRIDKNIERLIREVRAAQKQFEKNRPAGLFLVKDTSGFNRYIIIDRDFIHLVRTTMIKYYDMQPAILAKKTQEEQEELFKEMNDMQEQLQRLLEQLGGKLDALKAAYMRYRSDIDKVQAEFDALAAEKTSLSPDERDFNLQMADLMRRLSAVDQAVNDLAAKLAGKEFADVSKLVEPVKSPLIRRNAAGSLYLADDVRVGMISLNDLLAGRLSKDELAKHGIGLPGKDLTVPTLRDAVIDHAATNAWLKDRLEKGVILKKFDQELRMGKLTGDTFDEDPYTDNDFRNRIEDAEDALDAVAAKMTNLPAGVTPPQLVQAVKGAEMAFFDGVTIGNDVIAHTGRRIYIGKGMAENISKQDLARLMLEEGLHIVLANNPAVAKTLNVALPGDPDHTAVRHDEGLRQRLLTVALMKGDREAVIAEETEKDKRFTASLAMAANTRPKDKEIAGSPVLIYLAVTPDFMANFHREVAKRKGKTNFRIIPVFREGDAMRAFDYVDKIAKDPEYKGIVKDPVDVATLESPAYKAAGETFEDGLIKYADVQLAKEGLTIKPEYIGVINSWDENFRLPLAAKPAKVLAMTPQREAGAGEVYNVGTLLDVMELGILARQMAGADYDKITFGELVKYLDGAAQAEFMKAVNELRIADRNVAAYVREPLPVTSVTATLKENIESLKATLTAA